jgi:hypothetical protein
MSAERKRIRWLSLDSRYHHIVSSARQALHEVRGGKPPSVAKHRHANLVVVTSYWKPWRCLFHQHGPGKKHHRHIELVDWQHAIVDSSPEAFLRGLIHSDGWRGLNKVHVKGKNYEYPRYQFSNRSDDIRRLFTDTCDKLAIESRPWGRYHISVARRASVELMDSFIGPKR